MSMEQNIQEQEQVKTTAELREQLRSYVEELQNMRSDDIRRFEVKNSATAVATMLTAQAAKEYAVENWFTTTTGEKRDAVGVVTAWLESAMVADLKEVAFVEQTKDNVTSYRVGDKKCDVSFENLDTWYAAETGGFLAKQKNYAKYVDLFLYTGRVYHRDRDGSKLNWQIPAMSDKARELFNDKKKEEQELKAADKTWTNKAVNRDRYDRQMMEVIRAITPEGFVLPAIRKEDKQFIVDTLIQTNPKRKNYVAVKSSTMIAAIFAAIYKAMRGEFYRHDAGDKAAYEVTPAMEKAIKEAEKEKEQSGNGSTPTVPEETNTAEEKETA